MRLWLTRFRRRFGAIACAECVPRRARKSLPAAPYCWLIALGMLIACDAAAAWDVPALLGQAAPGAAPAAPPTAPFTRGPGNYFNIWKILGVWALFATWVGTTDWISRDCLRVNQNYKVWNSAAVGSFFLAFVVMLIVPMFVVGYPLLWLSFLGPLVSYIVVRNKAVKPDDKVLTRKHIRRWAAAQAVKLGMKVKEEPVDPRDAGPEVKFSPRGGASERDNSANMLKARQSPGYPTARKMIHEAVKARADGLLLDYGKLSVLVRHQIDGLWVDAPNMEREVGDPALEVFKILTALNPADRRTRQVGGMGIETLGKKLELRFTSQGTESGERAIIVLESKKLAFNTLEELGMRGKLVEELVEILKQKAGFVLLSTTERNGLSTLCDVTLNITDRFVRNFVAIEDKAKPERETINVTVQTYDAAKGESPATAIPKTFRSYPDVFVCRDLVNAETVSLLCHQVTKEKRFVFSTIRAKEAVEALLRVLLLKVPPLEFASAISVVINGRLVRKLCEKCKEPYAPPTEVLRQLGLPPGKVPTLYRPPTKPIDPKKPEVKCEACAGIGYLGRTGFYEVLIVNDQMRSILVNQPRLESLREAARKAQHRTLQDEGVLLVARGATSLQELLRVMKS